MDADLVRMRTVLEASGYQVVEVTDADTTQGYLDGRIRTFVESAPEDSTVVVYVSGHGLGIGGSDYLVPKDAFSRERMTGNPAAMVDLDLTDAVRRSNATAVILLADCCREQAAPEAKATMRPAFGASLGRAREPSRLASVFGCQPGEYCYYSDDAGYSLFTEALATTMAPDSAERTVREVVEATDRELQKLIAHHLPGRRQHVNSAINDLDVLDLVICEGRPDRWRPVVAQSKLWARVDGEVDPRVVAAVEEIASAAWDQFQAAAAALPHFPWGDAGFPERCLHLVDDLLAPDARLSAAEVAVLLAAPFLREAVLCAGLTELAPDAPLDLTTPVGPELDVTFQMYPRLVAKALALPGPEQAAVAGWLLNRHLLRRVELWNQNVAGELCRQLARALVVPGSANQAALQIRAVAAHVAAARDDFDREADSDKPQLLDEVRWNSPGHRQAYPVRQRQLAMLLAVAGSMAFDPRQADEAIVNHIGIRDRIHPVDVLSTLDEASWTIAEDRQIVELAVACPHPAVDLAWQSQAAQVDGLLGLGGPGLPRRVSTTRVEPQFDDEGQAGYERPLLGFRLDHDEIRELLMGVRLYGDPNLAVRELYQNALDACRYRQARHAFLDEEYRGQIVLRQGVAEDGRPYLECEDNGVGMGRRELEQLFSRAGRRFVTSPEFLWEQARWRTEKPSVKLWPNSRFGIGVFSYFMVADEITITSARVDRRTLAPGEVLRVDISSSGSLFRIRTAPEVTSRGGTTIRLYLRNTDVSALRTLRSLLWFSEFSVTCVEDDERETWPAVELHTPTGPESLSAGRPDDLWFVDGTGRILADGIATDEEPFGYVVNLAREHVPVLSVDRNRLESWDRDWTQTRLLDAAREFAVRTEPNLRWLFEIVSTNPILGNAIWKTLADRDAHLTTRGVTARPLFITDEDTPAPQQRLAVREIGAFPFDAAVLADQISFTVTRATRLVKGIDLESVVLARLAVLKDQGAEVIPFGRAIANARETEALHLRVEVEYATYLDTPGAIENLRPKHVAQLPVFDPIIHALMSSVINSETTENQRSIQPYNTDLSFRPNSHIPAWAQRVNALAASTDWPIETLLQRARSLVIFGFPTPGPQRIPHGAENPPSFDDDEISTAYRNVASLFIVMMSVSKRERSPLGEVSRGFGFLHDIGLPLPKFTLPSDLNDHVCSTDIDAEGQRLPLQELSETDPAWFNLVPLVKLAHQTEQALGASILLRLLNPPTEALSRARECVTRNEDLTALSINLDGSWPWISSDVSIPRIGFIASHLRLTPRQVISHLRQYEADFELHLPEISEVSGIDEVPPELPDRDRRNVIYGDFSFTNNFNFPPLLDRDTYFSPEDYETPLTELDRIHLSSAIGRDNGALLRHIAPGHLARVACFLDQTIGQVLGRMRALTQAFPVTVTPIDASATDLKPTRDDLAVLSVGNNGQAPWLEVAPSPLQVATMAARTRKPLGWVCRRLTELRVLVPDFPQFDDQVIDSLSSVVADVRDLLCLSVDLRIGGVSLAGAVSPLHVVRVAARLSTECSEVVGRLRPYAALGLDLSAFHDGPWLDHVATWHDLILLTVECRAQEALPPGPLPEQHIQWSAWSIGESEDFVTERLRLYQPLFGYVLP
ncbi:hypothetical protein FB565_003311 [Actinoplanes lutulentus]|nr:hypothetical protein [Actinoplanes lutulentus]